MPRFSSSWSNSWLTQALVIAMLRANGRGPLREGMRRCYGWITADRDDPLSPRSSALEQQGDALADADAHGGDGPVGVAVLELARRGQGQPGAAHAERVTERDR